MKKSILFASWLGLITTPYIFRKLTTRQGNWTGGISTLYATGNDEIGYYIFPGILCPPEKVIKDFIQPKRYDLHFVHYGHRDYNPILAAEAVSRHIKGFGYKKVRIISISMGDQLLRTLGSCLSKHVQEGRIEIISIDSLPNPTFISNGCLTAIKFTKPLLKTLRILGGVTLEIPCFKRDKCWRSPAEVIEQLSSFTSWDYDYTECPIFNCIRAIIKDGRVFYDPEDAGSIFDKTFNDQEGEPLVYFNTLGELANIRDKLTVRGYRSVFESLGWKF